MPDLPFSHTDAKDLIPDATSSLCGVFLKSLLRLPVLFYQLVKVLSDDAGNLIHRPLAGDLIFSVTSLAESDWRLKCDGRAVSRETYANLFAAISTTYGVGDGSTTFNLPDYRARFPVGVGTFASGATATLGTAAGSEEITLADANMPFGAEHTHVVGRWADNADDDIGFVRGTPDVSPSASTQIRQINGNFDALNNKTLGDQSGNYAVTLGPSDVPDEGDVTPHNNLPPFLPCFIYVWTGGVA